MGEEERRERGRENIIPNFSKNSLSHFKLIEPDLLYLIFS